MNNSAKQNNVIHWHREKNNLVSIFIESKLKGKIRPWIVNKFDGVQVFTSGLESGYLGASVMVVMNFSLARHVYKVSEVPGRLLSIKLLFKNKLSVSILELYAGAFSAVQFSQAGKVNSLIAKAVNESFFIVLSGDFNEDSSHKCVSFKKCLDLGLVNSLAGSPASKLLTWTNSRGVMKTIDYVFVSPNLIDVIVNCEVLDVTVSMAVGLGGLLDMQLNSLHRQANRNHWKFNFKSANEVKWNSFKGTTSANATLFSDEFDAVARLLDLDAMWSVICRIMVFSAGEIFKKKWFKKFNDVFTKDSLKFYKLELLVLKIIKTSHVGCALDFASLMEHWASLDSVKASTIQDLVDSGVESGHVFSTLLGVRKSYRASKLVESQSAKETNIRFVISRRNESFEINKGHMIRSILEHLFCKVVLDHLVVDDELILEPDLVKSKVDVIMESWTRKCQVVGDISVDWCHQYQPLEYVFDEAFSGVMCSIGYDEFFGVVFDLPDGKAAGLLVGSGYVASAFELLFEAWVLMIPKSYEWEGVLTNTHPIALIKTTCKILSKILSDRISLACSTFDVLQEDNFSVLKGTTIQSPIFAIGSVVEDALEKNRELWLHLEKSLVRIKMCSKFIQFFGGIHRDHTNQVMTDFGLTSGYYVHDGLDQREIFSPLLWHIFYDPLLCEVKRQESVYGYRLNSHFVSKNGRSKFQAGFFSFFTTGAFVDNTIWVGSSQMATQHILNVTSEFFCVNDISINNDKTVAIFFNSRVSNSSLSISSPPISIGLSKPSLVKAHSDVCFFTNLVMKKAVSHKQFLYLVSAVLHPIVSYRTQFNALIRKGLKLKSGLPLNFPNDVIYHPLFYDLKSFFQIQSESKIASLVSFVNFSSILSHLFSHRFHDLQVLCWCPIHLLSSPVHIRVSASNNFLAGMVHVLLDCNMSLGGSLVNSFQFYGRVPMSTVLSKSRFFRFLPSLWWYGIAFVNQLHDCHDAIYDWYTFKWWKRLDPCGPVPEWFKYSVLFLDGVRSFHTQPLVLGNGGPLNILESSEYVLVHDRLLVTGANSLSVYTDGSLSNLGTVGCKAGTAVFFEDISMSLDINVSGLMLSTLAELQAIALALECVSLLSSVHLFSDSQSALYACRSELCLVCPNFCNQCWVERHHIVNLIHSKELEVSFHKIKGHSGIPRNEHANEIAGTASFSKWYLPSCLSEHFLMADGGVVSGNARHFICDIYRSICRTHWEVGSGFEILVGCLFSEVDWLHSSLVWHPDLHMATGFTSKSSANVRTYFIKALHYWLPIEMSDHVFFCKIDKSTRRQLLNSHVGIWKALSGSSLFSSGILHLLSSCVSDSSVFMTLFKGFVFNGWFRETVCIFCDPKIAVLEIVKFVHSLGLAFREDHHAYIEKNGLIPPDGSAVISVYDLASRFSAEVVKLLAITNALGVYFGFRKFCLFFSDIGDLISVHIDA
ncbi:hypothetical protein G9A89_019676 [Geosiphon pyriformis]|nr:hypothetical protein G9A89_019676 [Geosiphon pyriformis]